MWPNEPLKFLEIHALFCEERASLVAQMVKNLPVMWENWVQSLGWEDPLEKGTATHSSILAWRIPWTEEPDRLQSMGSQITSWQIEREKVETVTHFISLGSKITADSDCNHEIKRRLLLERKTMTNLAY